MKTSLIGHYNALQKASGIEVGDTVRILRVCKTNEMGWGCSWNAHMDKTVGMKGTVTTVSTADGIRVDFAKMVGDRLGWWYPFFALEIVKKRPRKVTVELNGEYSAEVYKDKIVVGCQTFDTSIIQALADAHKCISDNKYPWTSRKPRSKK